MWARETTISTGSRAEPVPLRRVDWGTLAYRAAYRRQLEQVEARRRGEVGDVAIVVEHPHVITLGRARAALGNVLAPGEVEVVEVERGGDVTYHGPGQLVVYPILELGEGERDLHRYLRNLEEAMIRTAARHGISAGREAGKTGVWTGGRKLASIGIACRRWVTFHGLAINVATDLAYFGRINPCGFDASVMTSLSREAGRSISVAEVADGLVADLADTLGRELVTTE
jgi:lipoate-protein ligase B